MFNGSVQSPAAPVQAGVAGTADCFPRRRFLAAAGALLAAGSGAVHAGDRLDRFVRPQAGNLSVSHDAFDDLLSRYVRVARDGINRVDYAAWVASSADRQALVEYVEQLSGVIPAMLGQTEQFAFWANLYNAVTLRVVVDAYPVRSIRAIRSGWLTIGPWDGTVCRVQGVELSLNDIEHRILRQRWRDPRVHYAVNCASLGCPNLRSRVYRGDSVDADLTAAARQYVNHPRGVRIADQKLIVSSIYRWYREDFGGSDAGVIEHLKGYATPDLRARLSAFTRISDDEYDWDLNVFSRS